MTWEVILHASFEEELRTFEPSVQDAFVVVAKLVADFGPQLGRPHVDTLKGSKHTNMTELRFEAADGEWRAAFAFDPERRAIVLVAGDKSGGSQNRFYKRLIAKADLRFSDHLKTLRSTKKEI
jgi:hypothetical protein